MKHTISWICMLFPFFAPAQSKATVDSTARSVLNELVSSWTLGVDSSSETVDIKVYNRFKNLFTPSATIDDDFNVFFVYDAKKKSGSYQVETVARPKSFDVYAHDIALQVRSLVIDSIAILDSSTADRRNILFRVRRRAGVQKTRQYVLPGDYADQVLGGRTIEFEGRSDSLRMVSNLKTKAAQNPQAVYEFTSFNTILISMSYESGLVRITSIKSISDDVVCSNDDDNDAVLNQDDSLQNKPGDFTAGGKPDYDLDGVADGNDKCKLTYGAVSNRGCPAAYFLTKSSFEGFFGLQSGSVSITLPGADGLGYLDENGNNGVSTDTSLFKRGVLENPGNRLAVYGGGSFTHYFGQKRKRTGISIGLTYTATTADYKLENSFIRYIFKASDGNNYYRRQITISGLKEEIKYGIFNVPVMFNFRSHLDKNHKLVLNLRAGPSLMVFRNTSNYNVIIDFGGLYQINPSTGLIDYLPVYNPADSNHNINFTSAYIKSKNQSPNAANDIFSLMDSIKYKTSSGFSSLDFASDKPYNDKQHMTRFAVAANLNIDFQYKVSEGFTLKFGPHFLYASYLPAKSKYKPVDRTSDSYQSIYKGNAKSNYSAYGMSLGFVYDF